MVEKRERFCDYNVYCLRLILFLLFSKFRREFYKLIKIIEGSSLRCRMFFFFYFRVKIIRKMV